MNAVNSRGLLRVHAGGRLVEQQQLRVGGERARDLEPALVAVGQVAGQLVVPARQSRRRRAAPRARSRASRLLALDALRCRGSSRRCRRLSRQCIADQHVLERRHLVEEADVLERPADAELGDPCGGCRSTSVPSKTIDAGGRHVDAGEHVEEGRLAGAVRADQANDRPARDREVDVVHRDEAAELLAHLVATSRLSVTVAISRPCGSRSVSEPSCLHVVERRVVDAFLHLDLVPALGDAAPSAGRASSRR